jgi:hypothetical protein
MSARDVIKSPAEIGRQRKSPAHLVLFPVTLAVAGVCCYALVVSACALATAFRKEVHGFGGYGEPTKTLIVIPLLLASIPVGLIAANLLVWSIPPARRFFDQESQSRPAGDFASSMRGLLRFSKYWISVLVAIGLGAALFGK